MQPTSHWVHDLDPFAIHFGGNFGIRWYGLSYVAAFVIAAALLALYHRRGRSPLDPDQQSTAIFALVLGVLLGGRIGYVLLYGLPEFLRDPLFLFRLWEGGMASHGGFAGVILALAWLARRFRVPLLRLGDLAVTLVPPGLLLGRIANFINGELWGRPSQVAWAVIFPQAAPEGTPLALIPPRHPSQLYEAALEGLFLLLYTQWRLWRTGVLDRPGRLSGEFLLLYAIVRIIGERFREPDASLILGMSRGTFYSIFVGLAGAGLIVWSARRRQR